MTPTPRPEHDSPAERYLNAWHQRHADASTVFADARDSAGRSSYQRLSALASDDTAVLDVACGTGYLLSLIASTSRTTTLCGVDLCLPELETAQARLPDARFQVARAQALPFADGSFDLVLCHMALMLMDQPEDMLAECRRVLRPGGLFSAITNRPAAPDAVAQLVIGAIRSRWKLTDPALRPPPLGDARTYEIDTLSSLLDSYFENVSLESFTVTQAVSRRTLWPYLVNSIYGLDAIPDSDGEAVLESLGLPDPVPWTVTMVHAVGSAPTTSR